MTAGGAEGARSLMRRVAGGDGEAAATLFQRHGDAVYRYIRGTDAGAPDAEDLTQEVFVRALMNAKRFRGDGSLEGWLLRIARTALLDERRREGARRERELLWTESTALAASDPPDPERRRLLSSLLDSLPLEDREVIVLSKFLSLSAPRIAEVLEIAPGAVRVRLHRALGRLTDAYAEVETS